MQEKIEILKKQAPQNIILMGPDGLGKKDCALELASAWLGTTKEMLSYHPDFKLIMAEQGCIRVEQAAQIHRMASHIPQYMAVCIILDAECMTLELQNKLLKVLEDGADILAVIFVTSQKLLDTLSSRCLTVRFYKMSIEQMYDMIEHPVLSALLASDGAIGIYEQIIGDESFFQELEDFFRVLCEITERKQTRQLLAAAHALKEKDQKYFPDMLEGWQLRSFVRMISNVCFYTLLIMNRISIPSWIALGNLQAVYTQAEIIHIFYETESARRRMEKKGGFTKNDFFSLLTEMILVD